MQREFPLWRLVVKRVATLTELETTWSLDDVAKANALLDMEADIQEANTQNVSP